MEKEKHARQAWVTGIGAVVSIAGALIAFLVSAELYPSGKPNPITTTITASGPVITPTTNSPTAKPIYIGLLSISGLADINLDTIPPAVGPSSSSTVAVSAIGPPARFQAELPSSLALVSVSHAPTLSQCLLLINESPSLTIDVGIGGWLCARTANGATAAINIESIKSSIMTIQVTIWS